jgi:hypothetical protein
MKNVLFLLAAASALASCRDKVYECPSLENDMKQFFPYAQNDTVIFKSGNQVRKLPILEVNGSEPYTCTQRGGVFMVKECVCERDWSIYGKGDSLELAVTIKAMGQPPAIMEVPMPGWAILRS